MSNSKIYFDLLSKPDTRNFIWGNIWLKWKNKKTKLFTFQISCLWWTKDCAYQKSLSVNGLRNFWKITWFICVRVVRCYHAFSDIFVIIRCNSNELWSITLITRVQMCSLTSPLGNSLRILTRMSVFNRQNINEQHERLTNRCSCSYKL